MITIKDSIMFEFNKLLCSMHSTDDKEGYAKALGKPILLLGVGIAVSGIIAIVIQHEYSIIIAVAFILIIVISVVIWVGKIQKRFS